MSNIAKAVAKKYIYIRDSFMDASLRFKKNFVVIADLNLKSRCPDCRSDVDFESHSLAVLEEYISFAKKQKCEDILLVGTCLKHISIRQALKIMHIKLDVTLHVLACEKHLVNSALIEMNCVNVVGDCDFVSDDDTSAPGLDIHVAEMNDASGKYLLFENKQWHVKCVNEKRHVVLHAIPPALAMTTQDKPGVFFVNKNVKPKFIPSTVDHVSYVKTNSVGKTEHNLDSKFTDRLKEISQMQKLSNHSDSQDVQSLIHEMEISDARSIVQNLYDDVKQSSNNH